MIKELFKSMLQNENIDNVDIIRTIEVIAEVLQAEELEMERISNYFNLEFKKETDFYVDYSTRYDSENFINVLRDFENMPRTVQKLIPIHRRRASNNILKLLTKEFFKGYNIDLKTDKENNEVSIEIYITSETEIDRDTVFETFEKIKNRLLVAGTRKVLKIVFRIIEVIDVPHESWTFIQQTFWGNIRKPLEDYYNKLNIETLYFNGDSKEWLKLNYSRLRRDDHRMFNNDRDDDSGIVARFDEIYSTGAFAESEPLKFREPLIELRYNKSDVSYKLKPIQEGRLDLITTEDLKIQSPVFKHIVGQNKALSYGNERKISKPNDKWMVLESINKIIGYGKDRDARFILGRNKISSRYESTDI